MLVWLILLFLKFVVVYFGQICLDWLLVFYFILFVCLWLVRIRTEPSQIGS